MRSMLALAAMVLGALPLTLVCGQDETPSSVQPTDEHAWLRQFEGEWKTTGKGSDEFGKDVDLAGVEYDRMVLGDFWLSFVYRSQFAEKPFVGHGMVGYDPAKRKYIGTWVDSTSPHMSQFEGSVDGKKNTLTLDTTGTDSKTYKAKKGRLVFSFQDPDHRTLQSYRMDDEGKTHLIFEIQFTRVPVQAK